MKKLFIILGILTGAGLLFWLLRSWHTASMVTSKLPATAPTSSFKPAVTDYANGSTLYAKTDGVALLDIATGNISATVNKNTYLGTVLGHDVSLGYYKVLTASGSTVYVDDGVVNDIIS